MKKNKKVLQETFEVFLATLFLFLQISNTRRKAEKTSYLLN